MRKRFVGKVEEVEIIRKWEEEEGGWSVYTCTYVKLSKKEQI